MLTFYMGEKKGDSEIAKSAEIMGFTIEIDQKSVYFEKKLCSLFSLICDSKIRFQTPYLEQPWCCVGRHSLLQAHKILPW